MASTLARIARQTKPNIWKSLIKRTYTSESPKSNTPADFKLTESCIKRVKEICNDNSSFLRVTVDGGGCSGFQYKFEIDEKTSEDDRFLGPDNRVVIDSVSLEYCTGATMDYHVELIKAGFRIINNPKAEQGCSCGASFALKLD
ncbi:Iron-sulfur cluster assembly 2 like, mitochondrial, partial [Pseudolycoriella hygida]